MAYLMKCSVCGHDVASNAQACPNCGAPVEHVAPSFDLRESKPLNSRSKPCPSCGRTISSGATVCPLCFANITLSPGSCPTCGSDLYPGVEKCPRCGSYQKKRSKAPIVWAVIGGFFLLFLICCAVSPSSEDTADDTLTASESSEFSESPAPSFESEDVSVQPSPVDLPEVAPVESPFFTLSQQNAIACARSYLELMGFSRERLVDQLIYEGYPEEDAIFAVDIMSIDWNEEALETAQSYLDFTSFSKSGLEDQLEYEGFTPEQIAYAIAEVGY